MHGDDLPIDEQLEVYHLTPPPPVDAPLEAQLGDVIRLIGYTILPTPPVGEGRPVQITLFWDAVAPVKGDDHLFIHLLDASGTVVAQLDGPPLDGILPTSAWEPGVTVPTELFLPDGLGPGTYTIQAGMYTWPGEQRLPITLGNGEEVPDRTIRISALVVD